MRSLVIGALAFLAAAAHAGYAQLTPPPGWSAGTGAGAVYQSAANEQWVSSTVRTNASLSVGGRAVHVPASMRMAANAPRMLAGRVGGALLAGAGGPWGVGLTVGAMLLLPPVVEWWSKTGFKWTGDRWVEEERVLEGYWQDPYGNGQYSSADAACKSAWSFAAAVMRTESRASCVGNGGTLGNVDRIGKEIVKQKPVEYEPRVRSALEVTSLPEALPNVVWPASWPVNDPVLNPDAAGKPQPLFVPTGNPVKNPNFDPSKPVSSANQPYLQPGIRVTPAPAPGDPWRVDTQPVDKPVSSPNPDENKEPDNPDADKPQDNPSLCEKHPDIVACQKLGNIEAKPLEKKTVALAINREEGFGPVNGSCPAPRDFVVMGQSFAFKWDFFCQFADGVRPIIVGVAYILAVMSFMGLSRKGD